MMSFASIAFIIAISLVYSHSKPFSSDDLSDFEIAIGKVGQSKSNDLSEESKRIRAVVAIEKRRLNDEANQKDASSGSGGKTNGNRLHETEGNPYGPEITQRTQGNSLTDKIEKANKGSKTILIEGDIVPSKKNGKRVVTNVDSNKWTNGVVPYEIEPDFPNTHKTAVQQAIGKLESVTCISFRAKTANDANYVRIRKLDGCWSYVGMTGGEQEISIGDGCEYESTAIHEFMHALGFSHEQNRPDRGSHIKVNFDNIIAGREGNFEKKEAGYVDYSSTYDYKSIMHYGAYDFSKNGQRTLEAISDPNMYLGGDSLTSEDISEMNLAYSCNAIAINGKWSEWSSPSSCSATCGVGTSERTRTCTVPSPANGGTDCTGDDKKTESCDDGACDVPIVKDNMKCSFENDMCGWESNTGYTPQLLTFRRNKGATPSSGTGPKRDANRNTEGYYVYLETSFVPDNVYGRMISSKIEASSGGKRCLQYKVHMFGEGMGGLKVISVNMDTNAETVIRKHHGNQHKSYWFKNEVSFDASTPTKIVFEGKRGASWRSDMALDDITITATECASSNHDCDFEASTCGWTLANNEYYPLELGTDDTPSSDVTGPLSAKSGKGYLFADGWSYTAWEGDESSLKSALIEASSSDSVCLTFSYHMDNIIDPDDPTSSDIGTLSVKTNGANGINTVWSHSEIKGIGWYDAAVTINLNEDLEIEFHVRRGVSTKGDIGIDDVKVKNIACAA